MCIRDRDYTDGDFSLASELTFGDPTTETDMPTNIFSGTVEGGLKVDGNLNVQGTLTVAPAGGISMGIYTAD